MGIWFRRSMGDPHDEVRRIVRNYTGSADQLAALIKLSAETALRMYAPVPSDGTGPPEHVIQRWHEWTNRYETLWSTVVAANMKAGYLDEGDPVITTRLILGMVFWVSTRYRPADVITAEQITEAAIRLLRLDSRAGRRSPHTYPAPGVSDERA